jgi:hypothetical protein
MSGSVTRRKACAGRAPRSAAASSRLRSKLANWARTRTATKHEVKVACAIVTVITPRPGGQPSRLCAATNSSSSDRPMMTSGTTSGANSMKPNSSRPGNRTNRFIASPAQVPSTSARVAAMTAICRLVSAAARNLSSSSSAQYQRADNPPQIVTSREWLNE